MECPLYADIRVNLFESLRPLTEINLQTLLYGNDNLSLEANILIFNYVQLYLQKSNRFNA